MEAEFHQELQRQLDEGEELERLHRYKEAFDAYSDAATLLTETAYEEIGRGGDTWVIARRLRDGSNIGVFNDALLWKVHEYLRSSNLFHIVRYKMARCLATLGYIDEAKTMFEEAIEFTPEGVSFEEPYAGLAGLAGETDRH